MLPSLRAAWAESALDWDGVDAIAVTHGPGLAGSLLVGVNVAKGLALARGKPLLGINHLEGHVYANWLEAGPDHPEPRFPLVALIVSGGHSDVVMMRGHGDFHRLGHTRDDAAGEAFDKVARMLGLGFPGGPAIERAAREGDPKRFRFPRAWLDEGTFDVSFSGLKTAVLHQARQLGVDTDHAGAEERRERLPVADLAASFQAAVVDVLAERISRAAREHQAQQVALGGGVAANRALLAEVERRSPVAVLCPRPALCTDNGAMIAAAGYYRYQAGQRSRLDLDVAPSMPIGESPVA
jgi:N6-L-threonylcarbamoyladenine synthase